MNRFSHSSTNPSLRFPSKNYCGTPCSILYFLFVSGRCSITIQRYWIVRPSLYVGYLYEYNIILFVRSHKPVKPMTTYGSSKKKNKKTTDICNDPQAIQMIIYLIILYTKCVIYISVCRYVFISWHTIVRLLRNYPLIETAYAL